MSFNGLRMFAIAGLLILAAAARADTGELESLLKSAITSLQDGKPDYSKMEPLTAAAVQQQIGGMRPVLQQVGRLQSATYLGIQSMAGASGEAYRVKFANGSMIWVISESSAGKIQILWTSGVEPPGQSR